MLWNNADRYLFKHQYYVFDSHFWHGLKYWNRFKKSKDTYKKSFTNIAEYIRHQIQLAKPKFRTIDFWTEQALINESRRTKILPADFLGMLFKYCHKSFLSLNFFL